MVASDATSDAECFDDEPNLERNEAPSDLRAI